MGRSFLIFLKNKLFRLLDKMQNSTVYRHEITRTVSSIHQ